MKIKKFSYIKIIIMEYKLTADNLELHCGHPLKMEVTVKIGTKYSETSTYEQLYGSGRCVVETPVTAHVYIDLYHKSELYKELQPYLLKYEVNQYNLKYIYDIYKILASSSKFFDPIKLGADLNNLIKYQFLSSDQAIEIFNILPKKYETLYLRHELQNDKYTVEDIIPILAKLKGTIYDYYNIDLISYIFIKRPNVLDNIEYKELFTTYLTVTNISLGYLVRLPEAMLKFFYEINTNIKVVEVHSYIKELEHFLEHNKVTNKVDIQIHATPYNHYTLTKNIIELLIKYESKINSLSCHYCETGNNGKLFAQMLMDAGIKMKSRGFF